MPEGSTRVSCTKRLHYGQQANPEHRLHMNQTLHKHVTWNKQVINTSIINTIDMPTYNEARKSPEKLLQFTSITVYYRIFVLWEDEFVSRQTLNIGLTNLYPTFAIVEELGLTSEG